MTNVVGLHNRKDIKFIDIKHTKQNEISSSQQALNFQVQHKCRSCMNPFCTENMYWHIVFIDSSLNFAMDIRTNSIYCRIFFDTNLPRPVLAFGYCRYLRLFVFPYVRVCVSITCLSSRLLGPVQARITKFVPKMQNTLVKVPIALGGNKPWPSRSNVT